MQFNEAEGNMATVDDTTITPSTELYPIRIWQFIGRSVGLALLIGCACAGSADAQIEGLDTLQFDLSEANWFPDGGAEIVTQPIEGGASNSWGAASLDDAYFQSVGEGFADIPFNDIPRAEDFIVVAGDVRYLDSPGHHNYISLNSFSGFEENSIWFGIGGGQFHVGTLSDFALGSSPIPGGVDVQRTVDRSFTNDTRVGLRIAYDVLNNEIRNFQIDPGNDGDFEVELLDAPVDLSAAGLDVTDWGVVAIYGSGGARTDDIFVRQLSLAADYNSDADLNIEDLDILCGAVPSGMLEFDYNSDGVVDRLDANAFAFDNGSLQADANMDGTVNFDDLLIMSQGFGNPGTWSDGDFDCSGTVSLQDLILMAQTFGASVAPVAAPVPEPASFSWLLFAAVAVGVRRSRRNHR